MKAFHDHHGSDPKPLWKFFITTNEVLNHYYGSAP